MTDKLKPCPFCGEKLAKDNCGNWEHINNDCILAWLDTTYGQIYFSDHEDFTKDWNRRADNADNLEQL